jgi:hypothetical protein
VTKDYQDVEESERDRRSREDIHPSPPSSSKIRDFIRETRVLCACARELRNLVPLESGRTGTLRLIGSIRSEYLDHIIVFGEAHLQRTLKSYASYYNEVRTNLPLKKDAPNFRQPQPVGNIAAIPILGGRHHQYVWT